MYGCSDIFIIIDIVSSAEPSTTEDSVCKSVKRTLHLYVVTVIHFYFFLKSSREGEG